MIAINCLQIVSSPASSLPSDPFACSRVIIAGRNSRLPSTTLVMAFINSPPWSWGAKASPGELAPPFSGKWIASIWQCLPAGDGEGSYTPLVAVPRPDYDVALIPSPSCLRYQAWQRLYLHPRPHLPARPPTGSSL